MKYDHLFRDVSKLAGLEFNTTIPIESSDEYKQRVEILVNAGVLFDPGDLKHLGGDFFSSDDYVNNILARQDELMRKEKRIYPESMSIIDTLGEYFSEEKKIVIYNKMCAVTASALKVAYDELEYVVALHEVSHAVTHLGEENRLNSGLIWEYFNLADPFDKELFAQVYPLFYLENRREKDAVDTFFRLANYQSGIYNSWRIYRRLGIGDINELLRLLRRKTPRIYGLKSGYIYETNRPYIRHTMKDWEVNRGGLIVITGENLTPAQDMFHGYFGKKFTLVTFNGVFPNRIFGGATNSTKMKKDKRLWLSCKPFFEKLRSGETIYIQPLTSDKIRIFKEEEKMYVDEGIDRILDQIADATDIDEEIAEDWPFISEEQVYAPDIDWPWRSGEQIAKHLLRRLEGERVNVIPSDTTDECRRTLLVAIGTGDDIVSRLREAAVHVLEFCPDITRNVIFVATKWDGILWRSYRRIFKGINVVLRLLPSTTIRL